MQGEAFPLPVPLKGMMTNVPAQLVPPDGIMAGSNCWVDIDGLMKPRFGYSPLFTSQPPTISGTTFFGPIIGLFWWQDVNLSFQYMAVSTRFVAVLQAGVWQALNNLGSALNGSVNDPAFIRSFFQNNVINVLICNNHDPIQQWATGQTTILPLTPTVALGGAVNAYTGTTNPTFGTLPVNTQFFFTFPIANTSAVTINLNGIGATPAKELTNGVVSDFTSGQLQPGVVYNFSYDGTELLLGSNLQAPTGRAMEIISDRVVVANILNGGIRNYTQVTWTTSFDMTVWPALAFYNLIDADDPLVAMRAIGNFAAIVYGNNTGTLMQAVQGVTDPFAFQFTPIQPVTTGPIGAAALVEAQGVHYFLGTDRRVWYCDGFSCYPISQGIDPLLSADLDPTYQSQVVSVFYPQYRQIWWWYPSAMNPVGGPTNAAVYNIDRNVFEPIQTFPVDIIRAVAPETASTGVLWNQLTNPWDTYNAAWNSFASANSVGMMIGTDRGQVFAFTSASGTDNGTPISYSLTPGYLQLGPKYNLLLSGWDFYFKPASTFEMAFLNFLSLKSPMGATTNYTNTVFDLSDERTWGTPQTLPTQQTYFKYMQMVFSGQTSGRAFQYGGGTVYVHRQERANK